MADPTDRAAWAGYLASYHDSSPGITEDVLADARDADGRSPYDWLIEAVPDGAVVVDLACGSGPLLRRLGGRAVVGVDRSAGELARARAERPEAPAVRADAAALPLAAGVADVITVSMALMVMHPLEAVLAEAARVLRPGGVLVATLPSRAEHDGASAAVRQFADILSELDPGDGYPNALDSRSLPATFVDAGFALTEVRHTEFLRRLQNEADAETMVRSFYAPGVAEEQIATVVDRLRRRVASGPVEVGYRLRRLVAVTTGVVPVPVRAGRVAAAVWAQAADIETAGRLPDALVSGMREDGVFDMWRPRELGGAEVAPEDALAAIQTVATGDRSTGWCTAVSVGTGALAAYLPEMGAREIFGKGPTITAGSFNPTARATVEAETLRVSGRWGFGSGSRHCDWLCGGALVVDGSGEPVVLDDGRPDARLVFFPVDRATIHDTWHVTGLRATGSHDYEVEGLDVPFAHTMPVAFRPWAAGNFWRMPPMAIFFAPWRLCRSASPGPPSTSWWPSPPTRRRTGATGGWPSATSCSRWWPGPRPGWARPVRSCGSRWESSGTAPGGATRPRSGSGPWCGWPSCTRPGPGPSRPRPRHLAALGGPGGGCSPSAAARRAATPISETIPISPDSFHTWTGADP